MKLAGKAVLFADDAPFDGRSDGTCAGVDVEFGIDVGEVGFDRGFADEELFGDVLVAQAIGE